jgi:hypothetical protein
LGVFSLYETYHSFFYLLATSSFAQLHLYVIYDPATPIVQKDIRKYMGWYNDPNPIMSNCRMTKNIGFYTVAYPFYGGEHLSLYIDTDYPVQTVPASQVAVLAQTHHVRTPAQLDADLQPAIEEDYCCTLGAFPNRRSIHYFNRFAKFYVIEYEGSNAKIIPCIFASEYPIMFMLRKTLYLINARNHVRIYSD